MSTTIVSTNNEVQDSCHKIANVNGENLFMSFGSAWHGKGATTDSLFNLAFIRENKPNLLSEVIHRPCKAEVNGEEILISNVNAIIFHQPDGTEKFFEARSAIDSRPIVQPEEWLQMLEDVFGSFGAKFSSVGYLYGGETFFVSAELPEGFSIAGDEHKSFFNAVDGYTGFQTSQIFGSQERCVCRNTVRANWESSQNKFSLNHTGNLRSRIDQLMLGFKAIVAARPAAIALLERATTVAISPSVAINRVLDSIFGEAGLNVNVTLEECGNIELAAQKRLKIGYTSIEYAKMVGLVGKQVAKRDKVFADIMANYESDTCKTARGSAYSAYQAITEYANFGLASKQTDRQAGNDFLSLANGKASALNDAAWNVLVNAV